MEQTARKFYDKAIQEGVRVKILGELEDPRIPDGLRGILQKLENDTYQQESTLTVCIAINYWRSQRHDERQHHFGESNRFGRIGS